MPVLTIYCSHCSTDFVDSRSEWRKGDEAICPTCNASVPLTAGFMQTLREESAAPGSGRHIKVEPSIPASRRYENR